MCIDGLTHVGVLWSPYDDHRPSQSFKSITMFLEYMWLRKHHVSNRVLWHKQTISRLPPPFKGGVVVVIDERWLLFVDHLFTSVTLASHPSTFAIGYIQLFVSVSHPYILPRTEKIDHMYYHLVAPHSLDYGQTWSSSHQEHACPVSYFHYYFTIVFLF